MYVRDLQGNEYAMMATYTVNDEINGQVDVTIDVLPNKPNSVFLKELAEFWELVDDNEEVFKIIYCKKQGSGFSQYKTIKAIPKLYDDMSRARVYDRYDGSFPIEDLFNIIFAEVDYTHTLIGAWSSIEIEGYGDGETCLSMFQKVLNRIGAEFTFMGPTVTIREKIGSETQIMYRHQLNASNIIHEVDAKEYYTYARGYGDYEDDEDGWKNAKLKREYTSPLASLLGKRDAPPIKNGNVTLVATMDTNLKKLVDESIQISVSADLIDLRKKNYPYAQTNLGDTVFLIDERIQMEEEVRVVKRSIKRDWKGDILDLNFTFGTQGIVSRYQSKLSSTIKQVTDILEGRTKLPFPAMANEIQLVTQLLKSVQTQLKVAEDGSLLAIDKTNPNYVVIFNAAGIGISDDGGESFKNALTGRGLLADAIVANSITADKLDVNAITVGFNNNSTNLKLHSDLIEFYKDNKKTAELNENGMGFWYGYRFIGGMGESGKTGNPDVRGVSLDLSEKGDYVAFTYKKNATDTSYTSLLTLDPKGRMTGWSGLKMDMPVKVVDDTGAAHELSPALKLGSMLKGQTVYLLTSPPEDMPYIQVSL